MQIFDKRFYRFYIFFTKNINANNTKKLKKTLIPIIRYYCIAVNYNFIDFSNVIIE